MLAKNAKKKKKKKKKIIKFFIFRFYPTFDMSYLNVYPHKMQKRKKKNKQKNISVAICFGLRQNIAILTGLY